MRKIQSIFALLMFSSLTLSGCDLNDFISVEEKEKTPTQQGGDNNTTTPENTGGGGEGQGQGGGEGQQTEVKYTVTFNANGGTGNMSAVSDVKGEYSLPACEFIPPIDKRFCGWKVNNLGDIKNPHETIYVNSNIVLYAQWVNTVAPVVDYFTDKKLEFYTVEINPNNSEEVQTYTLDYIQFFNDEEHSFEYVSTYPSNIYVKFGTYTLSNDKKTATVSLTSEQTDTGIRDIEDTITVTYDASERLYKIHKDHTSKTVDVYFSDNNKKPEHFEYPELSYYLILFDGNGATSGEMSPIHVDINTGCQLPKNTFVKNNYIFVGWSLTLGGEKFIDDQANAFFMENTTLYAVWVGINDAKLADFAHIYGLNGNWEIGQLGEDAVDQLDINANRYTDRAKFTIKVTSSPVEFKVVFEMYEFGYGDLPTASRQYATEGTNGAVRISEPGEYYVFIIRVEGMYYGIYIEAKEPEPVEVFQPVIFYGDPTAFQTLDLSPRPYNEQMMISQLHLDNGDEFYIQMGEEDFRYYENFYAEDFGSAAEALAEGTVNGSGHNFIVTNAGSFNIFAENDPNAGEEGGLNVYVTYEPDVPIPEPPTHLVVHHEGYDTTENLFHNSNETLYQWTNIAVKAGETVEIQINGVEYGADCLEPGMVADLFTVEDNRLKATDEHYYTFYLETDPSKVSNGKPLRVDCEDYFEYYSQEYGRWFHWMLEKHEENQPYFIGETYLIKGASFRFNVHDVVNGVPGRHIYSEITNTSNIFNDKVKYFENVDGQAVAQASGLYHFYLYFNEEGEVTGLTATGSLSGAYYGVEYYYLSIGPETTYRRGAQVNVEKGQASYEVYYAGDYYSTNEKIRFYHEDEYFDSFLDGPGSAASCFSSETDENHYFQVQEAGYYEFFLYYFGDTPGVFVRKYREETVTHVFNLPEGAENDGALFYVLAKADHEGGWVEASRIGNQLVVELTVNYYKVDILRVNPNSLNISLLEENQIGFSVQGYSENYLLSVGEGDDVDVWDVYSNIMLDSDNGGNYTLVSDFTNN